MFTWAAKSVLKNLGRRKYQAAESSRKNAQDLVLAAERSHVPGIRIPLGEQTSEKPVLDAAIALDRNGLVAFAPENGLLSKNVIPNSVINVKSAGRELTMARKLPAEGKSSPTTDHQLRAFPAFDFSHDLGISKQKTKTWNSTTESAKVLRKMGPSSYVRSGDTDFGVWSPELTADCEIVGFIGVGPCGLGHHSLPSIMCKR